MASTTTDYRRVWDRRATRGLAIHDAVLARILDHAGLSVFCGLHPSALSEEEAREVGDCVRQSRCLGRRPRPPALMRPGVAESLLSRWAEAVARRRARGRGTGATDSPLTPSASEAEPRVRRSEAREAAGSKRSRWTEWLDAPLAALGDKTPRQAARSAGGRRLLERILLEAEYLESRVPVVERFDFAPLRRSLGLG